MRAKNIFHPVVYVMKSSFDGDNAKCSNDSGREDPKHAYLSSSRHNTIVTHTNGMLLLIFGGFFEE